MVVIRRLEVEELERERKLIALREHRETLFNDVALDAACLRKVREVLAEHGRVKHTPEHRFGARVVAALEHNHFEPTLGEQVCGHRSARPGSNDRYVKAFGHQAPASFAGRNRKLQSTKRVTMT